MSNVKENTTKKQNEDRENWSGRLDFIMSCIGYSVGIGNIWRFPYLCYKNGGGAFLIPYLLFMVVGAVPIFFLEYAVAQFSSSSTLTVWKICPLMKGVGYGALLVSAIFCVYFNIFMTWTLYFLYQSMTSVLPWSHCNNEWNTENCLDSSRYNASISNVSKEGNWSMSKNLTKMTASEEYWKFNVLQITSGIEDVGSIRLELLACLFIAWVLVFLCLFNGIKSSGKIVYVTVTFPYIVLVIFLVRAVTLPGAIEGIKFFIIPKWHNLLSTKVWGEAAVQIFFSSGAGWGAILTLASFNKFHHNMYRDAMIVPAINSGTSIFAGFVTFSILGFMAHEKGMAVEDVLTQGPGLVFMAYPEAISRLPVSPLWSILFFLMMLTIAIDTQFGTFETITSALTDEFPQLLRKRKMLVTAGVCFLGLVLDIPLIMQGGIYILQIVDWYCGLFTPMLVAVIECIVIGWIYGTDQFYKDIEMMIGYKPCRWWSIFWKFITPIVIMVMLVFNMTQLQPVSYNTYQYPSYAIVIGWVVGMVSVVPIPLYMIKAVACAEGTIQQRIRCLLRPVSEWETFLKKEKNRMETCTLTYFKSTEIDKCESNSTKTTGEIQNML
ncbi:sodium- and chloride-dependent glycine transporter 2-like [Mytilus californianus]|uniref:sodium- and chloride-dependent glycine transporter 2-like n=1 Tax=Mytilus californianus TaxID=6549 RepID=UPI0022460741|nr:sodium- and chloride-dependent glycine transporter 2-like [Mytilus californianus]